jgi:hypothetical protein
MYQERLHYWAEQISGKNENYSCFFKEMMANLNMCAVEVCIIRCANLFSIGLNTPMLVQRTPLERRHSGHACGRQAKAGIHKMDVRQGGTRFLVSFWNLPIHCYTNTSLWQSHRFLTWFPLIFLYFEIICYCL